MLLACGCMQTVSSCMFMRMFMSCPKQRAYSRLGALDCLDGNLSPPQPGFKNLLDLRVAVSAARRQKALSSRDRPQMTSQTRSRR